MSNKYIFSSLIIPLPRPLAGKAAGPNGACFRESGILSAYKIRKKKVKWAYPKGERSDKRTRKVENFNGNFNRWGEKSEKLMVTLVVMKDDVKKFWGYEGWTEVPKWSRLRGIRG